MEAAKDRIVENQQRMRERVMATQDRIKENLAIAQDRYRENQQQIRESVWAAQDRIRENQQKIRENVWAVQDRVRSNILSNEILASKIRALRSPQGPGYGGLRSPRVAFHERPYAVGGIYDHGHVFMDRHLRLHTRIISPGYWFSVFYRRGPHFTFGYCHPYYHRKYVFISLGGYWPIGYNYARYYWYGYHPYDWYGYYPIAREVGGDTYNYYTYNYYGQGAEGAMPADYTALADVRERLAQQAEKEPDAPTLADRCFEEAVKAFEAGDYDKAVEQFAKASTLAPDDMVLPFAYSQALLADGQYSEAAQVLRAALAKGSPDKEGVFFPRGLYPDDQTILEQIERLIERVGIYSFDADLQLLLGYQLLGIGEIDAAIEPLLHASKDLENAGAAQILLKLAEKIKAERSEAEDTEPDKVPAETRAIDQRRPIKVKETVLVATMCALVGGTRIGHYVRC